MNTIGTATSAFGLGGLTGLGDIFSDWVKGVANLDLVKRSAKAGLVPNGFTESQFGSGSGPYGYGPDPFVDGAAVDYQKWGLIIAAVGVVVTVLALLLKK